jgi:hypothetical protein
MTFGAELFRLQFVSVAVGLLWFAWFRWNRRCGWDTSEQLPLLLLVSFVTAPYGAWPFDMVLLLPAIYQIVVRKSAEVPNSASGQSAPARFVLVGLVAVNLGCLVLNLFRTGSFWFLWVSPAILALYVASMKPTRRSGAAALPPVAVPA